MGKFIFGLLCFVLASAAQDVRAVLDLQTAAWNRGDLVTFVDTYENSKTITFLGKELTHGRDGVLARYQRTYNTPEKMGKLRFELLETRALGMPVEATISCVFTAWTPFIRPLLPNPMIITAKAAFPIRTGGTSTGTVVDTKIAGGCNPVACQSPASINFYDLQGNTVAWCWKFGDGAAWPEIGRAHV